MARVSLELLKKQVYAEDFESDDDLLEQKLAAAESQVIDDIGWTEEELSGIPDDKFPPQLKEAILMFAANLYRYREITDTGGLAPVPNTYQSIIKKYCRLCGGGLMERLVAKYPAEREGA